MMTVFGRSWPLILTVFAAGPLFFEGDALAQSRVSGSGSAAVVTIQDATANGAISAEFAGTGASSGASVRLSIKRSPGAPDPITVSIPPGTVLRSSDTAAQSMVVSRLLGVDVGNGMYRPMSLLTVRGSETVVVTLLAFCAEFEKENPTASTSFVLERPDPTLACLLNRGRELPVAVQQAAVWVHTDRVSYQHMNEKFPITSSEWAAAERIVRECATDSSQKIDSSTVAPPASGAELLRNFFGGSDSPRAGAGPVVSELPPLSIDEVRQLERQAGDGVAMPIVDHPSGSASDNASVVRAIESGFIVYARLYPYYDVSILGPPDSSGMRSPLPRVAVEVQNDTGGRLRVALFGPSADRYAESTIESGTTYTIHARDIKSGLYFLGLMNDAWVAYVRLQVDRAASILRVMHREREFRETAPSRR